MNLALRLATLAASALAGWIGPMVTRAGWKALTGNKAPSDEPGESPLIQVVGFAALSAAIAVLVQRALSAATTRAAATIEQRQSEQEVQASSRAQAARGGRKAAK